MTTTEQILRPYINVGDFVKAESNAANGSRIEAGIVELDVEGTMRIAKAPDADPYGPDGLPVQATWVNVLSWIKAAPAQ